MLQHNTSFASVPQDAHERERLENLHPSDWRNPQPADRYNLVVIGAGPAGLVAAHAAAARGAKVALDKRDLRASCRRDVRRDQSRRTGPDDH